VACILVASRAEVTVTERLMNAQEAFGLRAQRRFVRIVLHRASPRTWSIIGAALASRAFGRFLYGVQPIDSASFAIGLCLLIAATVAGTVIPARRAVRMDPTAAMRAE
jgi:hypothetical protein